LVADDDAVTCRLLERTLWKNDYDVIAVSDGQAAWNILQSERSPSLAILDWMMPGLNGLDLVRRIRQTSHKYTFTILLTSKSDPADIVCGLEAGADDYLTKPFHRDELLARLRVGERILQLEQILAEKNNLLQCKNQQLAQANLSMKQDLMAAAEVQETLLPHNLAPIPRTRIEWLFRPCRELAGDTLNVFKLDETHYGLYLLDVSGHGVRAALLSVTLSRILSPLPDESSLLRRKFSQQKYSIISPAEVGKKLNRRFAASAQSGQYFTLVYGILDITTLDFVFISAGHPESIWVTHRDVIRLENTGLPIGVAPEATFAEKTINLSRGDRLFIHSDGISEAINDEEEQFGLQRMIRTLTDTHDQSLRQTIDSLFQQVRLWSGGTFQDDISLLALEISR